MKIYLILALLSMIIKAKYLKRTKEETFNLLNGYFLKIHYSAIRIFSPDFKIIISIPVVTIGIIGQIQNKSQNTFDLYIFDKNDVKPHDYSIL